MSDEEERDRAIKERLEQIDRYRIGRGFDRTGEIDADLVWMRDRINEYRSLFAAAREAGREEGRRECAGELRAELDRSALNPMRVSALADRWSPGPPPSDA